MNSMNLAALSYEFCELCTLACRTDRQYLCEFFKANRYKEHGVLGKASKWALHLRQSCSYQVSGVEYIHNSDKKENNWDMSYWFILYFPIYVDEKIETAKMICLHIARLYLGCVDIR